VALIGEGRDVYRVLVGKPGRKRPLERNRRRWEDNIKMELNKVGCRGTDWIDLAQERDRLTALLNASITNNIRYTSQTQQIYYGVQGQVNDNMFRPFYSNTAIIRSSKVT